MLSPVFICRVSASQASWENVTELLDVLTSNAGKGKLSQDKAEFPSGKQ